MHACLSDPLLVRLQCWVVGMLTRLPPLLLLLTAFIGAAALYRSLPAQPWVLLDPPTCGSCPSFSAIQLPVPSEAITTLSPRWLCATCLACLRMGPSRQARLRPVLALPVTTLLAAQRSHPGSSLEGSWLVVGGWWSEC